jgi:hypothetical protein
MRRAVMGAREHTAHGPAIAASDGQVTGTDKAGHLCKLLQGV